MLTLGEVLRRTAAYLAERGIPSARLDADLLLGEALGMDRMRLYLEHDRPLTEAELATARALVARRARREPIAYILGRRAFRGLEIAVTPDVLVPRPDTETLVEWAVAVAPHGARVMDWGTGSGAIALALADERPDLAVTAVDVSPAAVAVAASNATANGLTVETLRGDGFAAVAGRRFGLIVANPPYRSDAELEAAEPELGFEPRGALAAGPAGDECIARLAAEAPAHLEAGGWLLCEIGMAQAGRATALLAAAGFAPVEVRRDLAGLDRVVGGTLPA
ncbi:MAG: peptide chain release factor N(5)-glutamine methyltransferase [Thermoleophilia bacterium]|nr:peptide chain release factor N(5)-glutamine methyltransferase [Thermoleophilia bacterium]